MGRKINPFGYRLGVIYDWKSRWFAKKGAQYSELLAEDYRLRKFIRGKVGQAGVAKIGIERFPNQVIVTIFTAKPGIIIGRKGAAVKELRESIEKHDRQEGQAGNQRDREARSGSAAGGGEHRRADRAPHQPQPRHEARGAAGHAHGRAKASRLRAAGRLAGSEMARRETVMEGRVPRSTLRADIDFARAEALTTYGRIGIKVWIYKGEVLPEAKAY